MLVDWVKTQDYIFTASADRDADNHKPVIHISSSNVSSLQYGPLSSSLKMVHCSHYYNIIRLSDNIYLELRSS